jgi:hypothetical protein
MLRRFLAQTAFAAALVFAAAAAPAAEDGELISSVGPVQISDIHAAAPVLELDFDGPADPPPPPPGPYREGPYTTGRHFERVGVYLGGIFQPLVAPEDDIDFLQSDIGWGFTVGYAPEGLDLMGAIGLEFTWEFSQHNDPDVDDTADYQRLLVGFKFIDSSHEAIQPYFSLGMGFYDVSYNNIDYGIDGFGGYVGGGMDFYLNETFSIGVDLKLHAWSGEDNAIPPVTGEAFSPAVSIVLLAHF